MRHVDADAHSRALTAVEELLASSSPNRRLALAQIEEAVAQAAPDVSAGSARRDLIGSIVGAMVDAGRAALPRTAPAWEHGRPDLPRWVMRVTDAQARSSGRRRRRFPWRGELEWAATLELTDAQFAALQAVQMWLRDRSPDDPACAVRERSVDIFGDDKRLDTLLGGPLFAPGRLSLKLLDCVAAYPPLAVRELPGGGDWLVVENATTFRTLAALSTTVPEVSLLIYGAGAQAPAGLPALLTEHLRPPRVWWFGDIDRDGLRFAAGAAAALAVEGLDVAAYLPLYRALARRGVTCTSRAAPVAKVTAARLASWIRDTEVERFAVEVLAAGRRAMQEQVGPRELAVMAPRRGEALRSRPYA
ncbi:MAG: hypothetical protein JSS99_06930 [Actinobacteria bacterium]|nr:hypothetical protein [Actinomycetota bacterium]